MVPERRDDVLLVAHGDAQRLSQAVQVALDVFQFLQGIADHIPVVHIPPVPVDAAHVLHVMVDGAGVVKGDDLRYLAAQAHAPVCFLVGGLHQPEIIHKVAEQCV